MQAGISFIVVTINLVLTNLIIMLIEWIGEATNSKQEALITMAIFMAQFINTALIILLANANLAQY